MLQSIDPAASPQQPPISLSPNNQNSIGKVNPAADQLESAAASSFKEKCISALKWVFSPLITFWNFIAKSFRKLFSSKEALVSEAPKINTRNQLLESECTKIERLEEEFHLMQKTIFGLEFNNWWVREYKALDPQTQKMLLLEDIHDRKSSNEEWTYENEKRFSSDFVVSLSQRGLDPANPFEKVPLFLAAVKQKMQAELKDL